jgi:protein involved in polysaccharide export with SLBB domain
MLNRAIPFLFIGTLLPLYLHGSWKDDAIYIEGPSLTISQLWKQVQERSPYSLDHTLSNSQASKKIPIDGLTPLEQIVNKTTQSLGPHFGIRLNDNIFSLISSIPQQSTEDLILDKEILDHAAPPLETKPTKPQTQNEEHINSTFDSGLTMTPEASLPAKQEQHTHENPLQINVIDDESEIAIAQSKKEKEARTVLQQDLSNDIPSHPYRLKPGDRIEISVWGENMTRQLVVSPDGRISYILVGEIDVLNLTFKELKLKIEQDLSRYLLNPNVTVIGKSFEGNYVSILGAVNSPGRKVVSRSDRVIDVITAAKGLKFENFGDSQGELANLKGAYLSRKGDLVPINFSSLLYEGDMTQNIPVEIGDFIYIPSSVRNPIFITGEVTRPTSMPYRGEPTLLESISKAQGLNIRANPKEVFLVRGGMTNPTITKHNYQKIRTGKELNPNLEPGDIIYVPPTTITRIERLSLQIIPFLNTIINSRTAKTSVQNW